MENHHAIQVQGLRKRFGEIQAVQGVSFDVAQGEIFSLLGPNGAGNLYVAAHRAQIVAHFQSRTR